MIILSNITRLYKIKIIFTTILAVSVIASFAIIDNMMVHATTEKNDNAAQQVDRQGQWVSQGAQCVSGEDVRFACNNIGILSQGHQGNLAVGQR